MKKILLVSNNDAGLYLFRKELIQKLVLDNEVHIAVPRGDYFECLHSMGCFVYDVKVDRRGINPFKDLKQILKYKKIIKEVKPAKILTYTIKPNIYIALFKGKKYMQIATITGLGTSIENKGLLSILIIMLYKAAFKKVACVFTQNSEISSFLITNNIVNREKIIIVNGSGVNITEYNFSNYPENTNVTNLIFVGRVMKNKGINEFLEAAQHISSIRTNVNFIVIGACEEDYKKKLMEFSNKRIISYVGFQNNVLEYYEKCNAIIHPTYHEGMSNVLLEAGSIGRPIIASNISGCKEIVEDGINGYTFEPKSTQKLIDAILKFIDLPYSEKKLMGKNSRAKIEIDFDREKIVEKYIKEIMED